MARRDRCYKPKSARTISGGYTLDARMPYTLQQPARFLLADIRCRTSRQQFLSPVFLIQDFLRADLEHLSSKQSAVVQPCEETKHTFMCVDKTAVRIAAKSQCWGLSTSTVPHLNFLTNTPLRSAGGPVRYAKCLAAELGVEGDVGDVCAESTDCPCPSSEGTAPADPPSVPTDC